MADDIVALARWLLELSFGNPFWKQSPDQLPHQLERILIQLGAELVKELELGSKLDQRTDQLGLESGPDLIGELREHCAQLIIPNPRFGQRLECMEHILPEPDSQPEPIVFQLCSQSVRDGIDPGSAN